MKLRRIIRKTLGTLGILLVFGLVKMPIENGLTGRLLADRLLEEVKVTQLTGLIGQSSSLAILGGLRSLVAIYTTLHAYDAWGVRDWDTVERDYRIIHSLVPDDIDSWKTGAWHLHSNAAASYMLDESLPERTRADFARVWVLKGVAVLRKGIEAHPQSSILHKELADVYRERLEDPCAAAKHYKLSMEGDAPKSYVRRFYGYFLARCPGHEQEAYDYLMGLYNEGKSQRLPTLIQRIKELEEKLAIPKEKRIPDPDPDVLVRQRFPNAKLP